MCFERVDWKGKDIDKMSYVISSEKRLKILKFLSEGPATPTRISKEVGISLSQVSRVLKELVDMRLVEEMSKTRKGKIFEIKYSGFELLNDIKERLSEKPYFLIFQLYGQNSTGRSIVI